MSRARHKEKHRASGGKAVAYNAADSNVMKEAHERKRGGRVHHGEGEKGKERHDRKHRKHGGKAEHHEEHEGHKKHHHHKGRARGGRIGSDKAPLSSAARIKEVTKGEQAEDLGQH